MKNWEKLLELDTNYRVAREKLIMGLVDHVEIKIVAKKSEVAALLKKKSPVKDESK